MWLFECYFDVDMTCRIFTLFLYAQHLTKSNHCPLMISPCGLLCPSDSPSCFRHKRLRGH